MMKGSCLCKSIAFTIDGEIHGARYCHCENCRKFSGASPAAWATADASKLSVTTSETEVSKYGSGRGIRCFCSKCGSPVWFESIDFPDIVAIPLGVLDNSDIQAPGMHIWTRSQPAWSIISDDLPKHETDP